MLNEQTRKGLKDLTTIGDTAILRHPWTSVLQKNKALIAFINLEELGEDSFEEFGLETMNDFLSLVDFYDNPEIEMVDGIINITSGKYHQRYGVSDLDTMKSFDVKVKTLENVENTPNVITLDVSTEDLARFKKVATLTKSTDMIINASDEDSSIIIGKLDRNQNLSDESETQFTMSVDKNISVIFDMANINRLPNKNFKVNIKQSAKTGNCISLWEAEDAPIKIVVAVQDIL